jgi:hypothetical protein
VPRPTAEGRDTASPGAGDNPQGTFSASRVIARGIRPGRVFREIGCNKRQGHLIAVAGAQRRHVRRVPGSAASVRAHAQAHGSGRVSLSGGQLRQPLTGQVPHTALLIPRREPLSWRNHPQVWPSYSAATASDDPPVCLSQSSRSASILRLVAHAVVGRRHARAVGLVLGADGRAPLMSRDDLGVMVRQAATQVGEASRVRASHGGPAALPQPPRAGAAPRPQHGNAGPG